jgi:SMC interacting uncharacterized protein involved in chromosome segregation
LGKGWPQLLIAWHWMTSAFSKLDICSAVAPTGTASVKMELQQSNETVEAWLQS